MSKSVIVFEIQKDKYNTRDEIRFAINIGISIDELRAYFGGEEGGVRGTPENCHWRSRLGRVLGAQSDVWWSIRNEADSQIVCEEISLAIENIAMLHLRSVAHVEKFIESWRNDIGQGLTEYERRVNIARLLVALGRKTEAYDALRKF